MGHRIAYKLDTDLDGDLDGVGSTDNVWLDQVYDDNWRVVATFKRGDATDKPRERFVYHAAGMDGRGTSSYIDDVILRERSDSVAWSASAPSTLGNRLYYLQNWRHDVSVLVKPNGQTVERIKYTSYGVPRGRSAGDFNGDGAVDDTDFNLMQEQYNAFLVTYGSPHTAKMPVGTPPNHTLVEVEAWGEYDLNNDGVVDDGDFTVFGVGYDDYEGIATGQLSRRSTSSPEVNIDNRIGYAGYAWSANAATYNVRFRIYNPMTGAWNRRDLLHSAIAGPLYQYTHSTPIRYTDMLGLYKTPCSEGEEGDRQNVAGNQSMIAPNVMGPEKYASLTDAMNSYSELLGVLELAEFGVGIASEGILRATLEAMIGTQGHVDEAAIKRAQEFLDKYSQMNKYIYSTVDEYTCQCSRSFFFFGEKTCSWEKTKTT